MRGLIFTGDKSAELRDFSDPQAGPGEAVIKVRASGICGSDLPRYHASTGSDGIIPGHEPSGVVVDLGPGAPYGLQIGDRVMMHHYAGCGFCDACAMGFEQACPNGRATYGTGRNGGHAEYLLAPARTLVHLPNELSFEAGAAIACGTGTAWSGLNKMQVSGRDTVAVFGQGPVGLSGTMCAKAMGARVIALDVSAERLDFARRLGADYVVNSAETDAVEAIQELTAGTGVSACLETSGSSSARTQALRALRLFGRCCYVGNGGPTTIDIKGDVIRKVLTLYGSWTFTKAEQIEISRFMVDGNVDLDKLITQRYSLNEGAQGYRDFADGTPGKPVIVMDE